MLSLDTHLDAPAGASLFFATELDGPLFVFRDETDYSGRVWTPAGGFQHLGKLALKAAVRCVDKPSIALTFALPDGRQDQTLVMEWSPRQGLRQVAKLAGTARHGILHAEKNALFAVAGGTLWGIDFPEDQGGAPSAPFSLGSVHFPEYGVSNWFGFLAPEAVGGRVAWALRDHFDTLSVYAGAPKPLFQRKERDCSFSRICTSGPNELIAQINVETDPVLRIARMVGTTGAIVAEKLVRDVRLEYMAVVDPSLAIAAAWPRAEEKQENRVYRLWMLDLDSLESRMLEPFDVFSLRASSGYACLVRNGKLCLLDPTHAWSEVADLPKGIRRASRRDFVYTGHEYFLQERRITWVSEDGAVVSGLLPQASPRAAQPRSNTSPSTPYRATPKWATIPIRPGLLPVLEAIEANDMSRALALVRQNPSVLPGLTYEEQRRIGLAVVKDPPYRGRCSHCYRQTEDRGERAGYSGPNGIDEDYEFVCATCGKRDVR